MTIIIGIKCENGIVVACDSRTTEPSGHIRDDVRKLRTIVFKDGQSALVATAGNDAFANRAMEMIEARAATSELTDYRSFATCAEEALNELRNQFRKQHEGSPAELLQKQFEDYAFELLIAHSFRGQFYIFTLDFVTGIAIKRDRQYCSIGCGWVLADFLISRLDLSKFKVVHGVWTVAYAVEEVKHFDSRCGGPTRIGIVLHRDDRSDAGVSDEAAEEQAVTLARDFSDEAKRKWRIVADEKIEAFLRKLEKNRIAVEARLKPASP